MKKNTAKIGLLLLIGLLIFALPVGPALAQNEPPTATLTADGLAWTLVEKNDGVILTVSGPDGYQFDAFFSAGETPSFSTSGLADGQYTYELVLFPLLSSTTQATMKDALNLADRSAVFNDLAANGQIPAETVAYTGAFSVVGGAVADWNLSEEAQTRDQVFADDLIVNGSECVGVDCVNNENFGADTIRLKENNLRINIVDTSVGSFPTNDWRLVFNDSTNGGASYFAVEDANTARQVFRVDAAAPSNSLYVDSQGDVGLGTNNPVLELHIADGDTPSVRLEQTGSSGFTPYTWDIAGNEAGFFIRDVTNGSKLSLRIAPNSPADSFWIRPNELVMNESSLNYDTRIESDTDPNAFFLDASANSIGLGTNTPATAFELLRNDGSARLKISEKSPTAAQRSLLILENTGGSSIKFYDSALSTKFFTGLNSAGNFYISNQNTGTDFVLTPSGNLTIDGTLTQLSDVNRKENFSVVDNKSILEGVANLDLSMWNYIDDETNTTHIGPMAQEFNRTFNLGLDERYISSVDVDGVALAAIQGLNEIVGEKDAQIQDLEVRLANLENQSQTSQSGLVFVMGAAAGMAVLAAAFWMGKRQADTKA